MKINFFKYYASLPEWSARDAALLLCGINPDSPTDHTESEEFQILHNMITKGIKLERLAISYDTFYPNHNIRPINLMNWAIKKEIEIIPELAREFPSLGIYSKKKTDSNEHTITADLNDKRLTPLMKASLEVLRDLVLPEIIKCKDDIKDYLEKDYSGFSKNRKDAIALIYNPDPSPGRKPNR